MKEITLASNPGAVVPEAWAPDCTKREGLKSQTSLQVLKRVAKVKNEKGYPDDGKSIKNNPDLRTRSISSVLKDDNPMALFRHYVDELLQSQRFDAAVGIIIVINSLCMGLETSFELENRDLTVFEVLEHIFLFVYMAELGLRFFAHGCRCLQSPWVLFDFVLVFMGVVSNYIVGPIINSLGEGNQSLKDSMGGLLVMRMLRLFRLARAVRLLVQFKTLWMLIRGLMGSAGTIMYTFGLILLILYIASCMAMELITKKMIDSDKPEIQELVVVNFQTIPIAMLTLIQFVSMDGMSDIYYPLILEDPVLLMFFLPFILVVSISLMNLVTAVIVESAIEQGKQDRDLQRLYKQEEMKKMMPDLQKLYEDLDENKDGRVTLDEIREASDDLKNQLKDSLQADSVEELFQMIDADEDGKVDVGEFCESIAKVVTSDTSADTIRILKQLSVTRKEVSDLKGLASDTRKEVSDLRSSLTDLLEHLKIGATGNAA